MNSYDEILDRMKKRFEELSGYPADEVSDIGIRLRVLAGEIYSLGKQAEGLQRQMFVSTASGTFLERHAKEFGMERLKGAKAKGRVMFQLDMPLEYELTIPKGVVCTNATGTLRFVTIEEKKIARGGNYALVLCEAEDSGKRYNVAPQSVTTIVTYFSVGISVTNSTAFTGGSDDENDESLRRRMGERMEKMPNGVNKAYYQALAESVEGVHSAQVDYANAKVTVYVAGRSAVAGSAVVRAVKELLDSKRAVGTTVNAVSASVKNIPITMTVKLKNGYTLDGVKANIEENLKNYLAEMTVGSGVTAAEIGAVIYRTDGVANYALTGFSDIAAAIGRLPVLGTLTVTEM